MDAVQCLEVSFIPEGGVSKHGLYHLEIWPGPSTPRVEVDEAIGPCGDRVHHLHAVRENLEERGFRGEV